MPQASRHSARRQALVPPVTQASTGGWWAAWWNAFGDPWHPSEFQRAIDPLFRSISTSPRTQLRSRIPPQLDRAAREAALRGTRQFRRVSSQLLRGRTVFRTPRLVALYATFSPIAALPTPTRRRFLRELARVADGEFHGSVRVEILTPLYTAQRV